MEKIQLDEKEILKALDSREYKPLGEVLETGVIDDNTPEELKRSFRMLYRNAVCEMVDEKIEKEKRENSNWKVALYGEVDCDAIKVLVENGLTQTTNFLADMLKEAATNEGFNDIEYIAEKVKPYLNENMGFDFKKEMKGFILKSEHFYYYGIAFKEKFEIPGSYNGVLIPFTDKIENQTRRVVTYNPVLLSRTYFKDLYVLTLFGEVNGENRFIEIAKVAKGEDYLKEVDRGLMIALEHFKNTA